MLPLEETRLSRHWDAGNDPNRERRPASRLDIQRKKLEHDRLLVSDSDPTRNDHVPYLAGIRLRVSETLISLAERIRPSSHIAGLPSRDAASHDEGRPGSAMT